MRYLLYLMLLLFNFLEASGQLYSSGNNVISGNNVGIGFNAPIYTLESRKNTNTDWCIRTTNLNGSSRSAFRIQNEDSTLGQLDFVKFGKNYGGTFMGLSRNNMSAINSLTGALVINAGARMVFGTSLVSSPFTQTPRVIIDSFGKIFIGATSDNVGIGSTSINPLDKLHVNSTAATSSIRLSNATSGHTSIDGLQLRMVGTDARLFNLENDTLAFGTNNLSRMIIDQSGKVVIGSTATPGTYKLYVEQGILTEKVKVAVKSSANWADHVFDPKYNLWSLAATEDYIQAHQHLPGIPSAAEVVEQGVDLGSMNAALLAKIEELTLHLIRMEKELNQLKSEHKKLEKKASLK